MVMTISIVITAYNVEKWIKETLESVINQTYKNLEIIVVDDVATDNTSEILTEYLQKDSRIKVLSHEVNQGPGVARRTGIQASTGEYVLLLDGDDWLEPNFIEDLVKRAIETDADIVSGGITVDKINGESKVTLYGNTICEGIDKVYKFWGEQVVFMNNKIIRRYLHDKVPYCTRRFIEDTPTIIPQMYFANKVAYVDNAGYHYRMQENSLTHQTDPFKTALYQILCVDDLLNFFSKYDPDYLNTIPIALSFPQLLLRLKQINPSIEMIQKYQEAWNEFTQKLLQRVDK